MNKKERTSLAILAAAVLSACGGGSSSTPPPTNTNPPPTQGITRNGIAVGPISTFGSVVVNGVRYETNAATVFEIDDNPNGMESDLDVGDTVTIIAQLDEDSGVSTALRVLYDDAVTGPVDAKDNAARTLTILGQTVQVTSATSFDDDFANPSFAGIAIGQIVEVSGLPDANGVIIASRIEPEPAGSELEVTGFVSSLDNTAQTFVLNSLTVDFSGAMLEGFANGTIMDGDFVEAVGTTTGVNGELIATEVEREDVFPGVAEDDFAELEGFITRFASNTDFDVSGFPVTTNAQTDFEDGTAQDLALNVRIEVEGLINANGVLVADDIGFRRDSDIAIAAAVDSVDVASNTVVVLGISVVLDELTKIEDNSSLEVDPLTLADIGAGDYVEIAGKENDTVSGRINATLFEREDVDDTVLEGFVSAATQPSLTVLGVTIQTDGDTEFTDSNDNELTASEFFALVGNGSLIIASGTETADTTLLATEVEIDTPN